MKKLLITLTMCVLLLGMMGSAVLAEADKLELEEAIDMVLAQNLELKLEKLNLEKAELQYQKKKASNLLEQSKYSELEAEHSLASAENTYQNVFDNLVSKTIQQYTDIRLSVLNLEIMEKRVKLEELMLEEAKAQYEIGDIGTIELLEQENSCKDTEFNLETAGDDYQQKLKEFKTLLGMDELNSSLAEFNQPSIWEVTEKEAVETAVDKSINLQLQKDQLQLAEIDLKRARVSASALDIEIAELSKDAAEVRLKQTREDIINSVEKTYYQFKQAVKKMNLQEERLTEAQEKYELRQKQYDAGLITKKDVLQYEINLLEAEHDYRSARASYYLNEQSLRQAMNLETGVFADDKGQE